MDLLARREHSRLELSRKLARRYEADLVEETLDRLVREGLQCDERFAESYLRQRAQKGYGPRRISRELQQRGVSHRTAERVIRDAGIDWCASALRALERKFGAAIDDASLAARVRRHRFLDYRGFPPECGEESA